MIPACAHTQDTLSSSSHSPNTALLLSLVPGGGQVYNHQAWKIPIIYGALGTVGYFTYSYYTQMKTYKDQYLFCVENGLNDYEGRPRQNIYNLYDNYNRNFQLFIFIDIAVYALNLIDAYVFGHLFDFEMDDNLAFKPQPLFAPDGGCAPGLCLSLRF